MILKLPEQFTLLELKRWVAANEPKMIQMTHSQRQRYIFVLSQRTLDRPLKFLGVPIQTHELD